MPEIYGCRRGIHPRCFNPLNRGNLNQMALAKVAEIETALRFNPLNRGNLNQIEMKAENDARFEAVSIP